VGGTLKNAGRRKPIANAGALKIVSRKRTAFVATR
jgi:hypothetical protein